MKLEDRKYQNRIGDKIEAIEKTLGDFGEEAVEYDMRKKGYSDADIDETIGHIIQKEQKRKAQ